MRYRTGRYLGIEIFFAGRSFWVYLLLKFTLSSWAKIWHADRPTPLHFRKLFWAKPSRNHSENGSNMATSRDFGHFQMYFPDLQLIRSIKWPNVWYWSKALGTAECPTFGHFLIRSNSDELWPLEPWNFNHFGDLKIKHTNQHLDQIGSENEEYHVKARSKIVWTLPADSQSDDFDPS